MFIPAMILIRLTKPSPYRRRQEQDLLQRTVDAESHTHDLVGRFDVDVGGAVTHGLGEDAIDDLDDRSIVGDYFGCRPPLKLLST